MPDYLTPTVEIFYFIGADRNEDNARMKTAGEINL